MRAHCATSRIVVPLTLSTLAFASAALASWSTTPDQQLVLGSGFMPQMARPDIVAAQASSSWVAWIDGLCFGTLRIQRIESDGTLFTASGMDVAALPGCHTQDVLLATCSDGSAVVCMDDINNRPLDQVIVHRIAVDGTPMWGDGVTLDMAGQGRIGAVVPAPAGDAFVVWLVGTQIIVHRLDEAGQSVWAAPFVYTALTSNLKLSAAIPDAEGGLMLVWDHPAASYFRRIVAVKMSPEGTAAWPSESVFVTPNHPFASRHTRHVVTTDGEGGVWVAYSRGAQQETTPVPIDLQRVRADGTLEFATPPMVSLGTDRQIEPDAWRDTATGDLIVAWRDGGFTTQTLRVQRMTPAGARLFGDQGVTIETVTASGLPGLFTGHWTGSALLFTHASAPAPQSGTVRMRTVHGNGVVDPMVAPLSGPDQAFALRTAAHGDDQVIMWFKQTGGPADMTVVAQLVHPDGSLGSPAHPADFNGDGAIDGEDLSILLGAWGSCSFSPCMGDLDHDGLINGNDLAILLGAWTG